MAKILVLHGPNLNRLGTREVELYGSETLDIINSKLAMIAEDLNTSLSFFQSNAEHELINKLHDTDADFIIINPAALGHTSIALRDAFLAIKIPFIEVHISNTHRRESFRQHSYLADIAVGTINGLGIFGYSLALQYAHFYITNHSTKGASNPYGYANY